MKKIRFPARNQRRREKKRIVYAAGAAVIAAVFFVILLLSRCGEEEPEHPEYEGVEIPDTTSESYGVFLGVDESTFRVDLFEGYDLVVIDAQELRSEQLAQLHAKGHTVFSYLNVGSIEKTRPYYDEFEDFFLDRYDNWPDERWVDVTKDRWKQFVTEDLVENIREKDPLIDGLFLDNLDIYSHVRDSFWYRGLTEDTYSAIREILEAYQEKGLPVLVNGADVMVSGLLDEGAEDLIIGVNQETVFSRIRDYENDKFGKQKESEREYFTEYLQRCRGKGLEVFLLEYTKDPEVEIEILRYCEENGFRCYISEHVGLRPSSE